MELLSPELVLVAPPDLARRAREQLPLPWELLPRAIAGVQVEARRRRAPSRGALGFGLFCLVNGIAPLAFAIAVRAL